jgi:hypothetical protein
MGLRFLIPFHASPDIVEETKTEVEVPIPGANGTIGYTDTYTYVLKPGPGDRAFRYQYQDPENANRLTAWATGLSLIVSHPHFVSLLPDQVANTHLTVFLCSIRRKLNIACLKSDWHPCFSSPLPLSN